MILRRVLIVVLSALLCVSFLRAAAPPPPNPPQAQLTIPAEELLRRFEALEKEVARLGTEVVRLEQQLDVSTCDAGQFPLCCPVGDTFCPAVGCVDLSTNSLNCGACGSVCGHDSDGCLGGRCVCGNGAACPLGEVCLNGTCTSTGCSDGAREGFLDIARYPDIAACSGGWSIPGVRTPAIVTPACGRISGDDSPNPDGAGCNCTDLCAAGWHTCANASEVEEKAGNCGDATPPGTSFFFATRQSSFGMAVCFDPGPLDQAQNDFWGCGNVGADWTCGVLNAASERNCWAMPAPWSCPNTTGEDEAAVVVKSGPEYGGVLCCRD